MPDPIEIRGDIAFWFDDLGDTFVRSAANGDAIGYWQGQTNTTVFTFTVLHKTQEMPCAAGREFRFLLSEALHRQEDRTVRGFDMKKGDVDTHGMHEFKALIDHNFDDDEETVNQKIETFYSDIERLLKSPDVTEPMTVQCHANRRPSHARDFFVNPFETEMPNLYERSFETPSQLLELSTPVPLKDEAITARTTPSRRPQAESSVESTITKSSGVGGARRLRNSNALKAQLLKLLGGTDMTPPSLTFAIRGGMPKSWSEAECATAVAKLLDELENKGFVAVGADSYGGIRDGTERLTLTELGHQTLEGISLAPPNQELIL